MTELFAAAVSCRHLQGEVENGPDAFDGKRGLPALMSTLSAEDREMIGASVEAYLADRYDEAEQRRLSETAPASSSEHWAALAGELGLFGLAFDVDRLGMGGGSADQALVMERLGRHVVLEPYLSTVILFGKALREGAMVDAEKWIERLISGAVRVAFAHGEPTCRYDPTSVVLSATVEGAEYRLEGEKSVVLDAPGATHLLVSARTSGAGGDAHGLSLFLIEADAPGILRRNYRTISGRPASELRFDGVSVPADRLLTSTGEALPLIEAMLDEATVMVLAEGVGIMDRLLADTAAYARQRRQFGQPLASFQAIQHRMADMLVAKEHSVSLVAKTLRFLEAAPDERKRRVSAAKAFVGRSLRFVAQQAVQVHGGMGITDELFIGRLFKRATEIERQFGTISHHLQRYAAFDDNGGAHDEASVSVGTDVDYDAFRGEVRAFIDAEYPAEKRALNSRQAGLFAEPELGLWWHRTLSDRGWIAPTWPIEYGGTDWDAVQRHIFADESARAGTPLICKLGLGLAAPAIIRFGTAEQKAFFLPRIHSGTFYFCQGFSEPGSGSDLASLSTRAVRDGDDYIVNGTKIWTTHAHYANWIFLLVRTGQEGRPQAGISFLLAPMDTPGITVRPIRSMSGEHEVNEVFLDNVRVPIANRIGAENEGWTVTKYLLEFERGGEFSGLCRSVLDGARQIARQQPGDGGGRFCDDSEFRLRLFSHEIDIAALEATEERVAASISAGENVGPVVAGIMKLTSSELFQRSTEFAMEALGDQAMPDQHEALPIGSNTAVIGPQYAAKATAQYLNARAWSIFGGSNEIQRNIIAALGCGLK